MILDQPKNSLEQQIYLLKTTDNVKEKAFSKLKEIKSKSDDSSSKSRQYLEGLLKIPFSIYKREPILCVMDTIRNQFKLMYKKYNLSDTVPLKESYTNLEIMKYIEFTNNAKPDINKLTITFETYNKSQLIATIMKINNESDIKIVY